MNELNKNEIIKDVVEIVELAKEEIENHDENISATLDLQDLVSLKGLLDLYQEEKEKNEKLEKQIKLEIEGRDILATLCNAEKEKNKELDKENQGLFEAYNFNDTNLLAKILKEYRKKIKNSISKDKIKAKIEESKSKYNEIHSKHYRDCGIAEAQEKAKIQVLQELLPKEE